MGAGPDLAFLATPAFEWDEGIVTGRNQGTDADGCPQLVARQGHGIAGRNIDRPHGLNSIRVQASTGSMFLNKFLDLGKRLDDPRLVVGGHDRHQGDRAIEHFRERAQVNLSAWQDRDLLVRGTRLDGDLCGFPDRGMLDRRREDLAAGGGASDRQVVGLRPARGKDDFGRIHAK